MTKLPEAEIAFLGSTHVWSIARIYRKLPIISISVKIHSGPLCDRNHFIFDYLLSSISGNTFLCLLAIESLCISILFIAAFNSIIICNCVKICIDTSMAMIALPVYSPNSVAVESSGLTAAGTAARGGMGKGTACRGTQGTQGTQDAHSLERTEELVMGPQLVGRVGLEDIEIAEGEVCSVEEASHCLEAEVEVAPRCNR